MDTKMFGEYGGSDPSQTTVAGNCPGCRQHVRFETLGLGHDLRAKNSAGFPVRYGQRKCPNKDCGQHIFFVSDSRATETFPPMKLDFDSSNIPTPIIASFTEAISCHASECYMASALMIRRTLEELCKDRSATGKNLKDRIAALGSKVLLPSELLQALDDLRLLGNDAAHIESKEYDQVGKDEVEVAVEFTKEVLKAVYQYAGLLAKLRSLKKQSAP